MQPRHRAPARVLLALVTAALAGGASLVGAAPAGAHNSLVASAPADGSTVTEPIAEVVLEFDQAVQTEFAQVAVIGPDQLAYQTGEPVVVGRTVTQALTALPDAVYAVSYRVISADGHPVSGTLSFTATGQAPAAEPTQVTEPEPPAGPTPEAEATGPGTASATEGTATTSPRAAVEDDQGGLSTPALIGIGIAVAAAVAGAVYAARVRRPGGAARDDQADTGP